MLDEQIVTAVATGNLKAIAEQPALLSNLAYSNVVSTNNLGRQNAVANQQAGNEITLPLVAKAVSTVSDPGPLAARSAVDVLTNNELADSIADLKSVIEAFAKGEGGHRHHHRLRDLELTIDENGRLVIVVLRGELPEIFVPGSFTRESVDVRVDTSRGAYIRIRKAR
ncbi:RebB family R body protein [Luteibacter aegosomatissinici]|uniref:RebB family R body protein n=1 Tax=Luteibacter aegosomatissinici TaxID=2911539 RepID=UPI001FF9D2D2|nr:RebB family R body protein [Luteibacter aegosomatissinici]UPG95834.1 RebB family R body protein [Luteibacter aegosomatissinici]